MERNPTDFTIFYSTIGNITEGENMGDDINIPLYISYDIKKGFDYSDLITAAGNAVRECFKEADGASLAQITTYEEAMNFKSENGVVTISEDVLAYMASRIKELEEQESKCWMELIKT